MSLNVIFSNIFFGILYLYNILFKKNSNDLQYFPIYGVTKREKKSVS